MDETLVTEATEAVIQVIEVANMNDYTAALQTMLIHCENMEYALQMLTGFGLFAVIICLCYFCYKFFRIFI